jgi:hypothetical protein
LVQPHGQVDPIVDPGQVFAPQDMDEEILQLDPEHSRSLLLARPRFLSTAPSNHASQYKTW